MLPFNTLISINRNVATPVYQQVAHAITSLIREGLIKPGSAIPSSRIMAEMLELHRKTIVAAYEELLSQDWIVSIPRKGMMVSANLPQLKPKNFAAVVKHSPYKKKETGTGQDKNDTLSGNNKNIYRLVINDGFPDARIAPVDALFRQYRYFLGRPGADGMTMYSDTAGSLNLRHALAGFLSESRGLNIEAVNILITRGAQMAIYVAASKLIRPGTRVIVGSSSYGMANDIFEHFGAKLVKVPVDNCGMNVEEIEKLCRKKKADMLYIIPHHHHPTTVTLSAARRMKLLSLIREYSLQVIEDDYDYDFHYARSPILPLASADHEGNVIYIGSITKTISSSIRMGYLIAGSGFVKQAAAIRQMIDIRGDVLMEECMAILFNNGDMQKHLKKSIRIYQQRRDLFCSLLESRLGKKVTFTKPAGGMSVWVEFSPKCNVKNLSARAAAYGLFIAPPALYNSDDNTRKGMRMGFASFNDKEIKTVISILEKIL